MNVILVSGLIFVLLMFVLAGYSKYITNHREKMIQTYTFPQGIKEKVGKVYPHLSDADLQLVMNGLREYFHVINDAGKNKVIAMPSQVIDVAWHEFILFTKEYAYFCNKALGRFIHHTPAEAMKTQVDAQDGIKRAWRIACNRERINTITPTALPLIFAIDTQLSIEDGFKYQLNCQKSALTAGQTSSGGYCATHIGCASGCSGSASGSSGSASDGGCSGSSGGCSGGCGGS